MTREVLQMALQYVESNSFGGSDTLELIAVLREVLAQPEMRKTTRDEKISNPGVYQVPVAQQPHSIIAGALFDFMSYLTSRKERIVLSASDDAAPAVDAIRDFSEKRGLSLDDAQVRKWIDALAQPEQSAMPKIGCVNHDCDKCKAQLEQAPIYQYQLAGGLWIDQTKESYDYNVKMGQAVVRILYTSPKRQPLTGEEIEALIPPPVLRDERGRGFGGEGSWDRAQVRKVARAIEAAHSIGDKA